MDINLASRVTFEVSHQHIHWMLHDFSFLDYSHLMLLLCDVA